MKKNGKSGQAIMELLVLILAFCICFLGLIFVMGLSIANIEIFMDAKYLSDNNAENADFGGQGVRNSDVLGWQYTEYNLVPDGRIPFLPKDLPYGDNGAVVANIKTHLDDASTSSTTDLAAVEPSNYKFNVPSLTFGSITGKNIFNTSTFSDAYLAANLLGGKLKHTNEESVMTLRKFSRNEREKLYKAFETIVGVKFKKIELENNFSNTVFMPAMVVKDK